jgi:hypothetical protein
MSGFVLRQPEQIVLFLPILLLSLTDDDDSVKVLGVTNLEKVAVAAEAHHDPDNQGTVNGQRTCSPSGRLGSDIDQVQPLHHIGNVEMLT